jgi:hypothetical protein
MLSCKDFPVDTCCNSCHDEWEDGYGDPLEGTLPDGREYMVCCAVNRWIETHPEFVPAMSEPDEHL